MTVTGDVDGAVMVKPERHGIGLIADRRGAI
jgi:hypothetical protein